MGGQSLFGVVLFDKGWDKKIPPGSKRFKEHTERQTPEKSLT